jgi:hypothetical protein
MRLLTRLLALTATSATLVALAPAAAFAAAPPGASGEFPAADTLATSLSTISTTFTDTVLAVPTPTYTVTPPQSDPHFACSPTAVSSHTLACTPTHSGEPAFLDGVYTVSYSFTGLTTGATSGTYTFVLDANAPANLAISPSPYNKTTAPGAPVVVSGTSFPGATVKVTLGSSGGGSPVTQSANASPADGAFSSSFTAPADGTLTATAAVTYGSGPDGPSASATTHKSLTTPAIVSTAPVADGAERSTNGVSPNGYTVTATEPLDASTTIQLFDSTHSNISPPTTFPSPDVAAIVPASALPEGNYTVDITLVDAAGNPASTVTRSFRIDNTAPVAPVLSSATDPVNLSNQTAFSAAGTAEANSNVTVTVTSGASMVTANTVATSGGAFGVSSVDVSSLPDGTLTVTATATDAAGNPSPVSNTLSVTKGTVARTAVTGLTAAPSPYNYAARNTDLTVTGGTQNDPTLVVDLKVSDTDPATADLTFTAPSTAGAFSHAFSAADVGTLTDGTLTVSAVVRDPAGNQSPEATVTVVKDTTKLAQQSLSPADASVHQSVPSVDAVFNEALAPGSSTITVKNHLGNTLTGTTTFSADGKTMTFTPSSPFTDAGSPFAVTVHAVDLNDSGDVVDPTPTTFSIDTTPPAAPGITSVTDPVNIAAGGLLSASGTATDPTATAVTLTVTSGAQTVSSSVPVTAGTWSVSNLDVSSLPDGALAVSATAQDTYGNVSTPASTTATKDTVAPVMTVHFVYDHNGSADVPAVMLAGAVGDGSGAAEADPVTLSVDDTDPSTVPVTGHVTPAADGTFSTTLDLSSLKDGTLTVTGTAQDAAGNTSPAATGTTIKDTVAPAAPVFTVAETVTPTGRVLVATGTAEPGSDVTLGAFDPNKNGPLTDVVANPTTGAFSTRLDLTGLADAPLAVGALATDAAFNDSAAAYQMVPTATAITVDPATVANHFVLTVHGKLAEPAQLALAVGDGTSTVHGGTFTVDQSTGAFTGTLDVTSLAPGQLVVVLTTKDADGNTALVLAPGTRAWGTASVALYTIASRVVAGTPVTLRGTVTRTDTSVPVGLVQVVGRDAYGHVWLRKNVGVSSTGTYGLRYAPPVTMSFTVTYLGDTRNHPSSSIARGTRVNAKVSARATTGSHLRRAVVYGGVYPNKHGRLISLYRVTSTGSWVRLQTVRVTSRSTYAFSVLLPRGYTTLVVYIGATPGNLPGSVRFRALRS